MELPACALFALKLIGVPVFHHMTLQVALTGLAAIVAYKLAFTGFKTGPGLSGLALHMWHEWVILANLFLLLMGFAILSRRFENSRIPDAMPAFLPDGWQGGLILLAIVFVLSSFRDNIAATLIGDTMARHVFRGKVHMGLVAIVAASNADGWHVAVTYVVGFFVMLAILGWSPDPPHKKHADLPATHVQTIMGNIL